MIRVLHLINDLEIGGAEVLLLETLRRLDRGRFDLRVASLLGLGKLGPRFAEAGIEVIDLSRGGRFSWGSVGRLKSRLRAAPCDILHCHLIHATLIGRWLRRRGRVPRMMSSQHFDPLALGSIAARLHRMTARWDDLTVAVSQSVADDLVMRLRVDAARVAVVENGLDLSRFHPGVAPLDRSEFGLGGDDFVIGTTASLTLKKGLDLLILAAAAVLREVPRAHVLIAGEGSDRARFESLIAANGLEGRIQLVGRIDEVPRFLRMLDVFVLPSRREAFGLSAAEAMACGCAVVHTRVSGLATLSEDGVTALHVPAENPQALADAITRVLRDRDLARRLGTAATAAAHARFGIERSVAQLAALWERMAATM